MKFLKQIIASAIVVTNLFAPMSVNAQTPKNNFYALNGSFNSTENLVYTDEDVWGYETNNKIFKSKNDIDVIVVFDDNKTPNYKYDDIIIALLKK